MADTNLTENIQKINEMVNVAVKNAACELAEKEGRGYVEAQWLQGQRLEIDKPMVLFIKDAEKLGYTADDFTVKPYISTNEAWYTWLSYRISTPIFGEKHQLDRIKFPARNTLHKNFVMPLIEKEEREQMARKMSDLEKQNSRLRERVAELESQLTEDIED